jgi:hypothetical protein
LDIICLCETHLDKDNVIDLKDYKWYGLNRKLIHRHAKKPSGGVGILIRKEILKIFSVDLIDKSCEGIIGIEFRHKLSSYIFIIYSCYLPPEGSVWLEESVFYSHLISQVYLSNYANAVYICGDFNSRIGTLSDVIEGIDNLLPRKPFDLTKNTSGETFIDFVKDIKFCIVNGRVSPENDNFTFISSRGTSVVDYIITPIECINTCNSMYVLAINDLIDEFNLYTMLGEKCKTPDHSILLLNIYYESCSHNVTVTHNSHSTLPLPDQKRIYNFDSMNFTFMNNEDWKSGVAEVTDMLTDINASQEHLDLTYSCFCKEVVQEMDRSLDFKDINNYKTEKHKRHSKPFWNDELTNLWNDMRKNEKIFRKSTKNPNENKLLLKEAFVNAQNVFDKTLRMYERQYNSRKITEIESLQTNDPKKFWSTIKHLGPRKTEIPTCVYNANGELSNDIVLIKNTWFIAFKNLYNNVTENNIFDNNFYNEAIKLKATLEDDMSKDGYLSNVALNAPISYDEIEKVVNNLKLKKASGHDKIPNEILRCENIRMLLYQMFSKCFENCLIPSAWKKAMICPIPKGSDKDPYIPNNYRGISLLSCVGKLYSNLLNNRLKYYLEELNLISEFQNGFRPKRSCEEHLFVITSIIRNRQNDNKDTFAAFIDMQKAFDSVNRNLLLFNLISLNVDGKFYKNLKQMYTDTQASVIINGILTEWFNTNTGVLQGDVLSPVLFNTFINELSEKLQESGSGIPIKRHRISNLMYADDIVLLAGCARDLQTLLDIVRQWCHKWQLKINENKTNVVHFRKRRKTRSNFQFAFGDTMIKTIECYRYLGLVLDEFLVFDKSVDILTESAGRALGAIIGKFKNYRDVGFKTFTKLYNASVIPIVDYMSSIWGFGEYNQCDKIQYRALQYYLGVNKYTPTLGIAGEAGWTLPFYRRCLNMIKLWNKLLALEETRLPKIVLLWDLEKNNNNFSSNMSDIAEMLQLPEFVITKNECHISLAKEILDKIMSEAWSNKVQYKPKLRTYITFKENFCSEGYLEKYIPKYRRALFTKLRLGVLPLEIETGRYNDTPVEERICKMCKDGVEDEIHFLCKCVNYNNFRQELYSKIEKINPNFIFLNTVEKFKFLLSNPEIVKHVSMYIQKSWQYRNNLLFI